MSKIFRKNRKKLLSESKFSKYVLYTLGEIALVVVGILIALQLNNLNDKRKVKEHIKEIAIALESDIISNVKEASRIIHAAQYKDSLIGLVLDKKVNDTMYRTKRLSAFILSYSTTEPLKDNLQKLINIEDQMGADYKKLAKELKHYKNTIDKEKEIGQIYADYTIEQGNFFVNNFEWFYPLTQGELIEDAITYFLEDPIYFNKLAFYRILMNNNHCKVIMERRNIELKCLHLLQEVIGSDKKSYPVLLSDLGFNELKTIDCEKKPEEIKHWKSFTTPFILNTSDATVTFELLSKEGATVSSFSMEAGGYLATRLPDGSIIQQVDGKTCIAKYKMVEDPYLIIK